MEFPVFKTKIRGANREFDLNNPKQREEYFNWKAGGQITKLRDYLKKGNTFIAYLLGKKNSGKGTYSKMFAEVVDPGRIDHFSIGDMIREVDKELQDRKKREELIDFLKKNYRGWQSIEKLISLLKTRSTSSPLLPTELILALVKREIEKRKKKALLIDGFPRDLDQINFTLFFRDLIDYRYDPDLFVLIDVPKRVIDERIKYRRICPQCQTSRNLKLLPTSKIEYSPKEKKFYLFCDNPSCSDARMVPKEGDEKGIGPIKERLKKDEKLMELASSLYGIDKVFLRNSVPKKVATQSIDNYELTPEYYYQWDKENKKVIVKERPWVVTDDNGQPSYSLLPPPVVVSLIKQIVKVLNL